MGCDGTFTHADNRCHLYSRTVGCVSVYAHFRAGIFHCPGIGRSRHPGSRIRKTPSAQERTAQGTESGTYNIGIKKERRQVILYKEVI